MEKQAMGFVEFIKANKGSILKKVAIVGVGVVGMAIISALRRSGEQEIIEGVEMEEIEITEPADYDAPFDE